MIKSARRIGALLWCLLLPISTMAQPAITPEQMKMIQHYRSLPPEELQQHLLNMQGELLTATQCMAGVDPNVLMSLKRQGDAIAAKVDQLCQSGDVAGAEAYAYEQGQRMMKDPVMQKLQGCSKDVVNKFGAAAAYGMQQDGTAQSICAGAGKAVR